jgi:DHA1 family tetracycline resistance protein-like MFS transporter
VLLDMLALGMVIPVLPLLIESFEGGNTIAAAKMLGVFGSVWALMQFFASPVLGSLSDHYGRRPVVLLSNLGLGADYVFMALAPSLGWLFVGRLISGITSASVPTAFAYIADVTPPEKRAKTYGILGAAFGVGFIIGPALGGVLGHFGPRLPFWTAGIFSLANALYGFFVLPESLAHDRRALFSWKRANPIGSLVLLGRNPQLLGFAAVHFLYYLAHQALQNVYVLYTGFRYGWGPTAVGISLAAIGVLFALVQGVFVGPVVHRFGERGPLIVSLCAGALAYVVYGLAPTTAWFGVGILVMSVWAFYGPSAQGLMTRRVGPHEQGQLQGALTSVVGITGIIGPAIFTTTFAGAIGRFSDWHLPGAPYLLGALLLAMAVVLAYRVTKTPALTPA